MATAKDNRGSIKASAMSPKPRGEQNNTEDPRGRFGAFLRHWIDTNHGGDESRLAESLGLAPRTIRAWMKGNNGPAFQDLDRVAEALGYQDFGSLGVAVRRFHS